MQAVDRIGRRLKLHDLHVLIAVAQTGSMSKAAGLLSTGQPAISRSVADLEHAVGARLLERRRQGVSLTKYGEILLEGGRKVFDDLQQTIENVDFLKDPTAGQVRIGSNPFLSATFVASAVNHISQRHPRMVCRLTTGNVRTLHQDLAERSVDLLVTRLFGPITSEHLNFEPLFDDPYAVVVGPHHPMARRRKVDLADLMDEQWVLPPSDGPLGAVAMEAFRSSGLDYPRALVIGPPEVRVSLLATGRFVSIVPKSSLMFSARHNELKVLPVKHPFRGVPVGIVTLKGRETPPLTALFIESCRQVAAQNAKPNMPAKTSSETRRGQR